MHVTDFLWPLKVTSSFTAEGSDGEKDHSLIDPSLYDTENVREVEEVDVEGTGAGRIEVTEAVCEGECHIDIYRFSS